MTVDKVEAFNEKHIGGEPSFDKISQLDQQAHHDMLVTKALNWYAANRELKDSYDYFITYCEKNQLTIRKDIPNDVVGNIGFLCRMIHRGLIAIPKLSNRIEKRYEELKAWAPVKAQKVVAVVHVETKPIHSDQFITTLTSIDTCLESIVKEIETEKKVDLTSVTKPDLKLIITYLKRVKTEYEGIDSLDAEYKACYPGKRIQNRVLAFIEEQVQRIEQFNKASKIPVITKPQSPAKQVAGMRCQKEYLEFKSIPLEKLIGAKAILLFNTKYRKIMYLEAKSSFSARGASFFEVDKSICKTSRQPEFQLANWMAMTKPQVKAAIDAIKGANSAPQVRIGDDTLFLREWR